MKRKSICGLSPSILLILSSLSLGVWAADEDIERSFQQTYVYGTYLKHEVVRVTAHEGVVTLAGTVDQEFHKALAQETVAHLPGVIHVNNQLRVKEEIDPGNSDAVIREKVQNMLTLHRSVNNSRTEVLVHNGVVTLRGQAISQNQKTITTQYAKAIEGVTEIRNEMTVDVSLDQALPLPNEKIDDASITALVRLTLQYHGAACSLANEVVTLDGVVLLSGTARNQADQDLMATLLSDIYGVESVVDTHNGIAVYGYYAGPPPVRPSERLVENNAGLISAPLLVDSAPIGDGVVDIQK
jgi:osmotically-inducible protein OsmY